MSIILVSFYERSFYFNFHFCVAILMVLILNLIYLWNSNSVLFYQQFPIRIDFIAELLKLPELLKQINQTVTNGGYCQRRRIILK